MLAVATFTTLALNETLIDPVDTNQHYHVSFLFAGHVTLTTATGPMTLLPMLTAEAFDAAGYLREVLDA